MVLMNVAAPLLAFAVVASGSGPSRLTSGYALTAATVLQLVLLWGWHAPVALGAALETTAGHAVMQTTLLVSALWFWFAVFADRAALHWRALLALLVTGKLFCLLGVLLIFAPRLLYRELAHSGHMAGSPLADQHLGGLLMVVVCPLTYVLAGIVISALGLKQIASEQDARLASQSSRKTLQAV
jgi:putative membrane protein